MVKLTKFHRKNIDKMLDKMGVESDTVDTEAYWDSSLSANENYEKIRKIASISQDLDLKFEKSYQKDEVQHYEQIAMEKEREYIEEQLTKGLEEIKKSTTPQLDKYYWELNKFVEILVKSDIHSLFLIGKTAMGKTFNTIRTLAKQGVKFKYVVGNISPLEMYHVLYNNRKGVLLFDDTQALIENKASMSVLLSALWSATKHRIVEWRTTSKKLKAPPFYEFEGKIIFTLNEVPDNEGIRTLLSRCFTYEMNFDYGTILKIMLEIAKIPDNDMSKEERFNIVDFIKENTCEATRDFNLRLQKKIETIYKFEKEKWKDLALKIIKPDVDLLIIKQLMESTTVVKAQANKFIELTGKSRRTFFRYKEKLVSLQEMGIKNGDKKYERVSKS